MPFFFPLVAQKCFAKSRSTLIEYLNNYFFKSVKYYLFLDTKSRKVYAYKTPRDIIDAHIPDLEFERDGISMRFNNREYLKSTDFMAHNVLRTIDLHKPLKFTGTDGQIYLNEALPHPEYHRIKLPKAKKAEIEEMGHFIVNDYIKDTICSGNSETFQYLLNWLSCIYEAIKVEIAGHFFTPKGGTGKSTLTTVIMKLLLEDITRDHKEVENNINFVGRSIIVLEEIGVSKLEKKDFNNKLNNLFTNHHIHKSLYFQYLYSYQLLRSRYIER